MKSLLPQARHLGASCSRLVRSSKTPSRSEGIGNCHRFQHSSTTDFGYKDVDSDQKERMVKDVFSKVADKYDVMNDVMSMGTHRLWKDELINMMGIPAAARTDPNYVPRHLDVAGGTGDVAFRSLDEIRRAYGGCYSVSGADGDAGLLPMEDRQIVVCDINPEMLHVGRQRAQKRYKDKELNQLGFVEGNAESLPFPDSSFDIYTIAFGLRNVTNKEIALREAYRVLKPGGRLLILEFSHIQERSNPLHFVVAPLYEQFSFQVIPRMGQLVAGDAASYQYLVESIRRFPKQEDLLRMVAAEGFQFCSYVNFTFGVVAVHSGFKI